MDWEKVFTHRNRVNAVKTCKKKSCGMCKPHKRGLAPRFKNRMKKIMKIYRDDI